MRPALSRATGVGTYLLNLVSALSILDQENAYHLFSSSWKERLPLLTYGSNFTLHDKRWPVRILNPLWNYFAMPGLDTMLGITLQITHSPTPIVLPSEKARSITMVHDLFFYQHPRQVVREMRSYCRLVKANCARSDAIIAVSEYTKSRILELLDVPASKIHVIRHGADPFFEQRASENEIKLLRTEYRIEKPYLLFAGTREPRKNLERLLTAFHNFSHDVQLVLAGPEGWGPDRWKSLVTNRVVLTGYLTREALRALYQGALAFVFPSLEEGFGLPMLEAMASGTPVAASRIPVFQEIGGDAFLSFDPADIEEIRSALDSIVADAALRTTLIEKGAIRAKAFSWKEAARQTLELYRML